MNVQGQLFLCLRGGKKNKNGCGGKSSSRRQKEPGAILVVVLGSSDSLVYHLQDIFADHFRLAQNTHAGSVSVQDVAVGGQLLELDLGQLHEPFDLVFGPVVVLDAECVDGNDLDAAFVADFHDLMQWNISMKKKSRQDAPGFPR